MELVRKQILLEPFIDRNDNSPNYGKLTATTFYVNIFLTNTIEDMGMFTNVEYIKNNNTNPNQVDYLLRLTGKTLSDYYNIPVSIITGQTESRLQDVISYDKTNPLDLNFDTSSEKYIDIFGNVINGVNRITNSVNPITYVFDADVKDVNIGKRTQKNGLVFNEFTGTNVSKISFMAEGKNITNTSLSAITKEEYLFGITELPSIKNDVFIDRGNISVFERHLKLSEITNINELTRYGRGLYNIVVQ